MKKCLFCAGEIQDEATKCPFCGEMLEHRQKSEMTRETTSVIVLCAVGLAVLIVGLLVMRKQEGGIRKETEAIEEESAKMAPVWEAAYLARKAFRGEIDFATSQAKIRELRILRAVLEEMGPGCNMEKARARARILFLTSENH